MITMRGSDYVLEYLEIKFSDGHELSNAAGWAVYDMISEFIYRHGSFSVSGKIEQSKLTKEIEYARKEGFLQADEGFEVVYALVYDDQSTDFKIDIEIRPDEDASERTASIDWSQFDIHMRINVNEFLEEREECYDDNDEY